MDQENNRDEKEQNIEPEYNEEHDGEEMYMPEIHIPEVTSPQVIPEMEQAIKLQREAYQMVQPLIKTQTQIAKEFQPISEAIDRLEEITKPITDMMRTFEKITDSLQHINWDLISQEIGKKIKQIAEEIKNYEEDFWCLDADILDVMGPEEIENEKLIIYVHEHLDEYIEEIIQELMFSIHKSLLWETLDAYKSGFYKLCAYSLFSIYEHLVSSWYVGNIKKEEISVHTKPNIRKRLEKIEPFTKDEEEQTQILKVFTQSVLRIHQKTFTKIPEELNTELNRNSIAHGFHDYDSIGQTDILKLFQLLKSSLVLRMVSKEDFDVQS